ncbi:MAG: bifunctional 5,10-methylenetetrahydrofolate dehydrogenase/5,10-methenyltetrahydrofolate cyclohydrolase [Clostridium sp.]
MFKVIDGKEVSKKVKSEIKEFVDNKKLKGEKLPKIASILVGNDGGSIYYLNAQEKVANGLGVLFQKIIVDEAVTEKELIEIIISLNNDDSISGIMMQLPLPSGLNEKRIINTISPNKDIDCLTYKSVGKLYSGEKGFIPCTPRSIITLLDSISYDLEGKDVVVLGRSNIVGKPVMELLLQRNSTVTICHSKTKNLEKICSRADVLIVAIGRPKFLKANFVKEGAVVIDVGTSYFEGKITGDVDYEEVKGKTSYITPVPGGVGALTTTLLIKNSCEALNYYED